MRPCRDAGDKGGRLSENTTKDGKGNQDSSASHGERDNEASKAPQGVSLHLKIREEKIPASLMRLTKYERVHILSVRANELVAGSEPLISMPGVLDPLLIAMEEMNQGLLTAKVVRTLPSGEKEVHALQTLL